MSDSNILLKNKGFDPSPVAGKIPLHADSINNPRCIGTEAYEDFWLTQIDRCQHGYETAGLWIPGRYYYYLNFVPITGLIGGRQYPWFVDTDYHFFRQVEDIKQNKKPGIIVPKARRKGLSEKGKTILSHGIRFTENYRGAITAGLETYVTGLRNKFEDVENNIVAEFALNVLTNNEKQYRVGYEERNDIGQYVERGYGGYISFETMYDDPLKLEGEYFHDVICEESGRYKLLGQVIESIKPALEFGSQMLGTFYIYGTGGNILSTSKDFKEMWDEAETLGFEKLWVPGTKLYYPFFGNPHSTEPFEDAILKRTVDPIKNLRKYEPYQIIGVEDTAAAEEHILAKRVAYAKLRNKKKLKQHNQNHPLNVEEAFSSGGSNDFDDELIYQQLYDIEGNLDNYEKVVMEREEIRNERGELEKTMKVNVRPATKNDPDWKIVHIRQRPMPDYRDLDVGGIDSYNQDKTQTTTSLGAMVVLRQGNRINGEDKGIYNAEYPVCLYYERPPRKEDFYEICLCISIYYKLIRNVMASAEQDFVIDYFKKNGGRMYLATRPRSFDSKESKQMHEFGAKMTVSSKPRILGIVQSWVVDYVEYCFFPGILRDLLAYDEEYIGTDWDSVDALALAKMRVEDMRTRPRKSDDYGLESDDMPEWKPDSEGNIVPVYKNNKSEPDPLDGEKKKKKEVVDNWRPASANTDEEKDPFDDVDDMLAGEFD